jgi:gamma-glutamylcyclotransferase (GGCT)/AIG2-like uncharacterized protein YtfP
MKMSDDERCDMLFTYGTLMQGERLHHHLHGRATRVATAMVTGHLLNLGRYPGLIAGDGRVSGELYRVDDPELLATLDRVEGRYYERRRTDVELCDGRRACAWIYWYRGPRDYTTPIPSGNWRNREPISREEG